MPCEQAPTKAAPASSTDMIASRLQAKMNTHADIRDIFQEELTVWRRSLVHLEHRRHKAHRMPGGGGACDLEADASAHRLRPIMLFCRLQIHSTDQLQRSRAPTAQLGTCV